jgi:hypothetical protein
LRPAEFSDSLTVRLSRRAAQSAVFSLRLVIPADYAPLMRLTRLPCYTFFFFGFPFRKPASS